MKEKKIMDIIMTITTCAPLGCDSSLLQPSFARRIMVVGRQTDCFWNGNQRYRKPVPAIMLTIVDNDDNYENDSSNDDPTDCFVTGYSFDRSTSEYGNHIEGIVSIFCSYPILREQVMGNKYITKVGM